MRRVRGEWPGVEVASYVVTRLGQRAANMFDAETAIAFADQHSATVGIAPFARRDRVLTALKTHPWLLWRTA